MTGGMGGVAGGMADYGKYAGAVGQMSGGLLKGIAGFFGGPKLQKHWYSDVLQGQTEKTAGEGLTKAQDTWNDVISRITPLAQQAGAEARALGKTQTGQLGSMIGNLTAYDPNSTYGGMLNTNIAALKDMATFMPQLGRLQTNLANMRLGYGGRPDSAYSEALRQRLVNTAYAPMLGQAYTTALGAAGQADQARLANIASAIGAMREQRALPGAGLEFETMPAELRQKALMGDIQAQQALTDVYRGNLLGTSLEQNKWANLFNQLGSSEQNAGAMIAGQSQGGGQSQAPPMYQFSQAPAPSYGQSYSFGGYGPYSSYTPNVPPSGYGSWQPTIRPDIGGPTYNPDYG